MQREILKKVGPAPVEIDELVRLLGASPAEVSAALLDLEFAGQLTAIRAKEYRSPSVINDLTI
ncbi:MAG: hypothetical protein HC933_15915 [Pleurocapsa sp. SU_196_0]|nr:hypothetical protein [Pleurocapsa sp. SU_196_0]